MRTRILFALGFGVCTSQPAQSFCDLKSGQWAVPEKAR